MPEIPDELRDRLPDADRIRDRIRERRDEHEQRADADTDAEKIGEVTGERVVDHKADDVAWKVEEGESWKIGEVTGERVVDHKADDVAWKVEEGESWKVEEGLELSLADDITQRPDVPAAKFGDIDSPADMATADTFSEAATAAEGQDDFVASDPDNGDGFGSWSESTGTLTGGNDPVGDVMNTIDDSVAVDAQADSSTDTLDSGLDDGDGDDFITFGDGAGF